VFVTPGASGGGVGAGIALVDEVEPVGLPVAVGAAVGEELARDVGVAVGAVPPVPVPPLPVPFPFEAPSAAGRLPLDVPPPHALRAAARKRHEATM